MKNREKIADLIEIGVKGYATGGMLNKDAYLDMADKIIELWKESLKKIEKDIFIAIKEAEEVEYKSPYTSISYFSSDLQGRIGAIFSLIQAVTLKKYGGVR